MAKTVDQFFNSYGATRVLRENLKHNLEVFGHDMTEEDKQALMRTNLIMIRQCLQDFGADNGD